MEHFLEVKVECVRKGISLSYLAKQIGISTTTLYRKMCGDTEFNRNELMTIKQILELNDTNFMTIFFKKKLA